jgi:hypothetical protein
VTINDHPALYALSRQFKGKTGCLVCLDDTKWMYLDGSKKVVYIRNRRFLKEGHKYRSKLYLKYFGNIPEDEDRPLERRHDGQYVYQMVKNICVIYGKKKMDGTTRDRSKAYLLRNSQSSFSILSIGHNWRSPMPLMLCTCIRMSLRVSSLP